MQFLGAFASRVAASPRWVVGGFAILFAAGVLLSMRLQVSADISSLMPQHSRLSGALLQALEDFGSTDRLIVVIESGGEDREGQVAAQQRLKTLADRPRPAWSGRGCSARLHTG